MALLGIFPVFVVFLRWFIECDHGVELSFLRAQDASIEVFDLEILIVKRIDDFRLEEGLVGLNVIKAGLDDCDQEIEHHNQYEENIKEVD
jgi:hypothetical protein